MPIEGPTVYRALRRELEIAQAEVERQREDFGRLEARMQQVAASRGQALLELARFSLPEMSQQAVERTLVSARQDLLSLLAEKERHEAGLRGRRDQGAAEVRRLESQIDALTDRLNDLVRERERLELAVAEALKADPEFTRRSELAAKAEADLHRDERRVEELRAEAQAKLPAYRSSALFLYLLGRKYGTPEYGYRGLSRRLDRWIARLIDFNRAKLGYEFLTRTPPLVEAEVASRKRVFQELMAQVEALEKAQADKSGLTAVLEEGARLGADRDRSVAALEKARVEVAEIEHQITALALPDNDFYRRGLERLQSVLARTESNTLAERARQTPEPKDDELVARVRAAEHESAQLGAEVARLADRRRVADRYFASLQELVGRFRSENFDSVRSVFSDRLDLAAMLEGIRRGEIGSAEAWRMIGSAQTFRPHQLDPMGPGGGGMIVDVLGSPQGRILAEAIGSALGGALREAGRRGVGRRSTDWGGGWSIGFPSSGPLGGGWTGSSTRSAARPSSSQSAPRSRHGGFTSGEGF